MTDNLSAIEKEGVTRFSNSWNANGLGFSNGVTEDARGNYVRYSDYEALARKAEALEQENAELRAFAASFKLTCVDSSFYKDCYLHINEPDAVSFRLGNGSQFSKFIANLEDRRARTLLNGGSDAQE